MCCVDNILSVAGMWRQVARAALPQGTHYYCGDGRQEKAGHCIYLDLFDIHLFLWCYFIKRENSFINIGGPKKDRLFPGNG